MRLAAFTVPHGSDLHIDVPTCAVTIKHPKFATVRIRPREAAGTHWWLSPVQTFGHRLELRK